jgi:hypothetical protein
VSLAEVRACEPDRASWVGLGTGEVSGHSFSEGRNTSSGGTFSPNRRTTRAILRLRVSARLSSIGVAGVSGVSMLLGERGDRGTDGCTRESGDTELRRRTR